MMGDAAASSGHSEDSDYEVGKHFDLATRPGPARTARAAVRLMTTARDTAGPLWLALCGLPPAVACAAHKPVAARRCAQARQSKDCEYSLRKIG